jgi:hypothetical protein
MRPTDTVIVAAGPVLARPDHLDGRHSSRAEQVRFGHIDSHVVGRKAEPSRHIITRRLWALHAGPDLALAVDG